MPQIPASPARRATNISIILPIDLLVFIGSIGMYL